jgi:hypothetical protein
MSDIGDSEDRIREEIGLDQGPEQEGDPKADDPVGEGHALAPPD